MNSENASTPGQFPGLDSIFNVARSLDRVIEYNGRKYELQELTLEQAARYSAFLKRRAKLEAAAECEYLPEDAKRALLRVTMESIAIGEYEPGSRLFLLSMSNPHCVEELLHILFHDQDESFTYDDAKGLVTAHAKRVVDKLREQGEQLKN